MLKNLRTLAEHNLTLDFLANGQGIPGVKTVDALARAVPGLHIVVDHALGCVLYPHMQTGQWAATTEFKINYLAAVKKGTLVAESRVLSCGRRSAVVRVDVTNGERLVCTAQGTLLISDPPGSGKKS